MRATRRGFLAGLLATGSVPALGWAAAGSPGYLAAAQERDGSYALYGLTDAGERVFHIPLPARGHAGAGHPHRAEAVAFARRPGRFAIVLDCVGGRVLHTLTPPEGRVFNGHGVYVDDGATLLTAEQRIDDSAGRIGVWNVAAGYTRRGELDSHGIAPRDIKHLPDGTLAVANGGIATDVEDREKLNIDSMRPNLSYIDAEGTLLDQVELSRDLHQNSIRHLALGPDGLVGFAMQWEGDSGDVPPLLGLHRRGAEPILAEAGPEQIMMQNYAGSIAITDGPAGAEVAITSPRGGLLHRYTTDGTFLGAVHRADICGLAEAGDGFLASDGLGGLIALRGGQPRALAKTEQAWDNHLVRLPLA